MAAGTMTPVPGLARWLLRAVAAAEHRDALTADLEEEAADRAGTAGMVEARRWSRRQVIASVLPLLRQRLAALAIVSRRMQMTVWRGFRSDVTLSLRRLLHAPAFTAIAVLTLALGIGGNTAVFTLIDRVMLKPLPVPRPFELYRFGDSDTCCVNRGLLGSFSLFSYDLYTHLRDAAVPEFSHVAAFQANTRSMTIGRADGATPPGTLDGAFVSGNYFQMFELVPAAGRLLQPSDDRRDVPPVAVISYRAWTGHFQRREDVIGDVVALNGVPSTIVGVAPQGFYGDTLQPDPADIWVPLSSEPVLQPAARLLDAKDSHWLYIIGRVNPGAGAGTIGMRLTAALQQWLTTTLDLSAEERRRVPEQHVKVISAAAGVNSMREEVAPSLELLQAVASAVLLIACANLANLLLAQGMGRRTEIAVRVALGAPRARLVVQALVESVLLACAGGLAGLAIAFAGARSIVGLAFRGATNIPVNAWPSPEVVAFAFAVSLATGVLFGIVPAVLGSRSDPIDAMRGAGRSTGEHGGRVLRTLVTFQVALSLVLLTSAGLLGRSLYNLQAQDLGFATGGRFVVTLPPSLTTIPPDQLESVYVRIRERLLAIPGVVNAAFSLYAPMSGDNWSGPITVDGHATSERLYASWNRVSPRYFETIGTPIIRGRTFDDRDTRSSPAVAVISARFAREFFGDADPIGRRIGFSNSKGVGSRDFEIVGVVGDATYQDAREAPAPTFYMPFLQQPPSGQSPGVPARFDRSHYPQALELQTAGSVPSLESDVRRALAEVDRRLTLREVVAMDEQVARQFNLERLIARLTTTFGVTALLLACLGLYGVTAYSVARRTREIGIRMAIGASVARRTREIGIRMAIGASRTRVLKSVLRSAVGQLFIGVAIGLPAVLAAGKYLQAQLFGVVGHDPMVIAGGVVVLGLSALVAALIPARRAATVDPVRALRIE
jgi:macrolide transport system ATP-binding/permease protein